MISSLKHNTLPVKTPIGLGIIAAEGELMHILQMFFFRVMNARFRSVAQGMRGGIRALMLIVSTRLAGAEECGGHGGCQEVFHLDFLVGQKYMNGE